VAESADASDLSANLSARRETGDAELLKFGEPCNMAIPIKMWGDTQPMINSNLAYNKR
jgi:hypothetical protein